MSTANEATQATIDHLVTVLVEGTEGIRGAVVGSADGHPISSYLREIAVDAATVAAMGSAMLGLSTQLVRLGTSATTANSHVRGDGGQVWVLDIGQSASLTVFATEDGDPRTIANAAYTTTKHLMDVLAATD